MLHPCAKTKNFLSKWSTVTIYKTDLPHYWIIFLWRPPQHWLWLHLCSQRLLRHDSTLATITSLIKYRWGKQASGKSAAQNPLTRWVFKEKFYRRDIRQQQTHCTNWKSVFVWCVRYVLDSYFWNVSLKFVKNTISDISHKKKKKKIKWIIKTEYLHLSSHLSKGVKKVYEGQKY